MVRFVFLFLLIIPAATWLSAAATNESLEELKARAAAAEGARKVDFLARIAERQLDAAAKEYAEGNTEPAQAALEEVVEYGTSAANTSRETRKRMKNTEIALRRISMRLEDISRSLAFDEREPVNSAIQKLEKVRTELLHYMFKN